MFLKRLFKWLAAIAAILAVALLLFVWVVLDVNPFEGSIDAPWTLVSNDVGFYVQFPGTRLLDGTLATDLGQREGFEALAGLQDELARAARQVAEQVNPQIPLGLFQIDLREDFLSQQMAIGGTIADYATMRLEYFVAVARVPFYARFVSALRREFVRDALKGVGDRVELRNKYFRVQLPPETVARLAPYRGTMAREDGDDALFFARVGDAIVVSDRALYIVNALESTSTLRNDDDFELHFIRRMEGGDRVEAYLGDGLLRNCMVTHGAGGGGRLAPLTAILPPALVGRVTAFAAVGEDGGIEVGVVDHPTDIGLRSVGAALGKLLDSEKGDTRFMLGAEGLGRFIPRERTVAAVAFHASGEDLRALLVESIPAEDRRGIDDLVRQKSKHAFTDLSRLLEEVTKQLGSDHLLILQRASVFDNADFSTFRVPEGEPFVPDGELGVTLVLQVNPSVPPDTVRSLIRARLPFLDLDISKGLHPSGKFHLAELKTKIGDLELVEPAYGVMPGGLNYVILSSRVEGAEAVIRTAEKASEPLVTEPGVAALLQRLPSQASVVGFINPVRLKEHLSDRVRQYARDNHLDGPRWMAAYNDGRKARGEPEAPYEEVKAAWIEYSDGAYSDVRARYLESLRTLDPIGGFAFSLFLGRGPDKKVDLTAVMSVPRGE